MPAQLALLAYPFVLFWAMADVCARTDNWMTLSHMASGSIASAQVQASIGTVFCSIVITYWIHPFLPLRDH